MPLKSRAEYEAELQQKRQARLDALLSLGSNAIEQDQQNFTVSYGNPIETWEQLAEILPLAITEFKDAGWHLIIQQKTDFSVIFLVTFNEPE